MNDKQHLSWIFDRLVSVYAENRNYDYMIRFKSIIDNMPSEEKKRSVIPTDEEVLIESVKASAKQYNNYLSECKKAKASYKEWRSKSWLYRRLHDYKHFPIGIMPMPTKHRIIAERMGLISNPIVG